jgi:hypothetical protein
MHVLGHDYVTYDGELVTYANLTANFHQQTAGANRFQQEQPAVATEGNEMKMVLPVSALKSFWDEIKSKILPFRNRRVGSLTFNSKLSTADLDSQLSTLNFFSRLSNTSASKRIGEGSVS